MVQGMETNHSNNDRTGDAMYSVIINNIVAYTFAAKFEAIYKAAAEKSKRPTALVRVVKA